MNEDVMQKIISMAADNSIVMGAAEINQQTNFDDLGFGPYAESGLAEFIFDIEKELGIEVPIDRLDDMGYSIKDVYDVVMDVWYPGL